MEITLTSEQQQAVEAWVKAGRFATPEDVVEAALSLLKIEDHGPWDDELMEKVRIGAEQLDRGEGLTYSVGESERFVEDVRRRAETKAGVATK